MRELLLVLGLALSNAGCGLLIGLGDLERVGAARDGSPDAPAAPGDAAVDGDAARAELDAGDGGPDATGCKGQGETCARSTDCCSSSCQVDRCL